MHAPIDYITMSIDFYAGESFIFYGYRALAFTKIRKDFMYKNTSYALRALVLGTLLATTGLGFVSANTTTHAHAVALPQKLTRLQ